MAVLEKAQELHEAGINVVLDADPRYDPANPARPLTQLRAAGAPIGQQLTVEEHSGCAGNAAYVNASFWENDSDDDEPGDLEVTVVYLCIDPNRYGHLRLYGGTTQPTPTPGGDPDEAEDSSETRVEQEAENQRQRRRELIRLNKEADAAQQVRKEFLRQALQAHPCTARWPPGGGEGGEPGSDVLPLGK